MKTLKHIFGFQLFKTNSFYLDLFPENNSIIEVAGVNGAGKTSMLKGLLLALMPRKKYLLDNSSYSPAMKFMDNHNTAGHVEEGKKQVHKLLTEMFTNDYKSYFGFTINNEENLYVIMYPRNRQRLEFEKQTIEILDGDSNKFFKKINEMLTDVVGNYNVQQALEKLKKDSLIDFRQELNLSENCDEFYTKNKKNNKLLVLATNNKINYENILLVMLNDMADSQVIINDFIKSLINQEIIKYNLAEKKNTNEQINIYDQMKSFRKDVIDYKDAFIFNDADLNARVNSITNINNSVRTTYDNLYNFASSIDKLKEYEAIATQSIEDKEISKKNLLLDKVNKGKEESSSLAKIQANENDRKNLKSKIESLEKNIEILESKNYDVSSISQHILKLELEIKDCEELLISSSELNKKIKVANDKLKETKNKLKKEKDSKFDYEKKIKDLETKKTFYSNNFKNSDILTNESKNLLIIFDVNSVDNLNNIYKDLNDVSKTLSSFKIFENKLIEEVKKESIEDIILAIESYNSHLEDSIKYIESLQNEEIKLSEEIKILENKLNKSPIEIEAEKKNYEIDKKLLISVLNGKSDKESDQIKLEELKKEADELFVFIKELQEFLADNKLAIETNDLEINVEKEKLSKMNLLISLYDNNFELLESIIKDKEDSFFDDELIFNIDNLEYSDISKNIIEIEKLNRKLSEELNYINNKIGFRKPNELFDSNPSILLKLNVSNDLVDAFNSKKETLKSISDNLDQTIVTNHATIDSIIRSNKTIKDKIIGKIIKEFNNIETKENGKINITLKENDRLLSLLENILEYLKEIEINKDSVLKKDNENQFNSLFSDENLSLFEDYIIFHEKTGLNTKDEYIFLEDIKTQITGSKGNHKIVQSLLRSYLYNKFFDNESLSIPLVLDEANSTDNGLLSIFLSKISDIGYNGAVVLIAANGIDIKQYITSTIRFVNEDGKIVLIQVKKESVK